LTYIISKRQTDNKYILAEHVDRPDTVLSHECYVTASMHKPKYRKHVEIHGPSACIVFRERLFLRQPVRSYADTVPCVRCLKWPTQADDWPTRHKNYGWPDSATVERIVSNGCDVVGVAHSLCKHDEWMSKHQWRLSFSRAEVVLLNSWTPKQQIIYHMLRYFMTIERLFNGDNTLSNYQIKMMMLWASETKPRY